MNQPIRPCLRCGSVGVHAYDGDHSPGHFVSCPNRNTTKGTPAESVGKCSNTRQMFRTTEAGAISAWNCANNLHHRKNYDAERDLATAGPRCPRCNLLITSKDGACLDCPGRKGAVAGLAFARVGDAQTVSRVRG